MNRGGGRTATIRTLVGVNVLWLGFSMLFDAVNTLVLPERLAELQPGAKASLLGVVSFLGIGLGAVLQPIAGAWSDAAGGGRRRLATVGITLLIALPALGLLGTARTIPLVIVGYFVVQAFGNSAQAAHQALLPDLVPAARRGWGAGMKGFMDLAGAVVGFAVVGMLLEDAGGGPAVAALALGLVITFAAATMFLRRHPSMDGGRRASLLASFHIDLAVHRAFVKVVVSRFAFLLGTYAVGRFFLFFVADRLGLSESAASQEAGGLLAALALITALAALPAGWASDRFGRTPLMVLGAALSLVGVLLLATARDTATMLMFGGLMALGSAAFSAGSWAAAADLVPPANAARFLGLANLGTAGAAACAGLAGPLVDLGGYGALFAFAAAAFSASTFALRGARLGIQSDVAAPSAAAAHPGSASR